MMAADAWTRLEQRVNRWRLAAIAGAVLVVVGLLYVHFRDNARDVELERLHGIISRDSSARVAAMARTDSAIAKADTAVRTTARADSGWQHATRAADRVPGIVASTKPDTVKIRELVGTVDTLRLAGDSLERAAIADTVAIVQLRVAFAGERAAWTTERNDLNHALEVSEARHRHWGLGATAGYGLVRDPAGTVHAGPSVTVGVTYRW